MLDHRRVEEPSTRRRGLPAEDIGELIRLALRSAVRPPAAVRPVRTPLLIANSSAPMSTIRPRKPCFWSPSRPCQRDMA